MLDDTPIHLTMTARQVGAACAAVRREIKKRTRENVTRPFVPAPGHANLALVKIALLTETEAALERALQPVARPVDVVNGAAGVTVPAVETVPSARL